LIIGYFNWWNRLSLFIFGLIWYDHDSAVILSAVQRSLYWWCSISFPISSVTFYRVRVNTSNLAIWNAGIEMCDIFIKIWNKLCKNFLWVAFTHNLRKTTFSCALYSFLHWTMFLLLILIFLICSLLKIFVKYIFFLYSPKKT